MSILVNIDEIMIYEYVRFVINMESILDYMTDKIFIGRIIDAVRTNTFGDISPVLGPPVFSQYMDSSGYDDYNKVLAPHDISNLLDEVPIIPKYHGLDWFKVGTDKTPLAVSNYCSTDDAYDKASSLLQDCMFPNTRTLIGAEAAIELIEEYSLTKFYHICHGLVYFPHILQRFLNVHKDKRDSVETDDISSMIARCIEHDPCNFSRSKAEDSLSHLMSFKEHQMGYDLLEIKLLPGKYTIDDELYELANIFNVRDSSYDSIMCGINRRDVSYQHLDVVASENAGKYTGFRDAYHCLLYGGAKHLQALIVRWDLWGDDCTADAAREFFNVSSDCPLAPLISHINRKSALLS